MGVERLPFFIPKQCEEDSISNTDFYGVIYTYTNNTNGKKYVGQTINPTSRKQDYLREIKTDDGRAINLAMKIDGIDKFSYKIIDHATDQEALNFLEQHYIQFFRSHVTQNGYNQTFGGLGCSGYIRTQEDRQRKREAALKRWNSPEGLEERKQRSEQLKGVNNPRFGKESTMKGKRHNEVAREIISQKAKDRLQDKTNHPRFGVIVTEETRKKIALSKRGKKAHPNTVAAFACTWEITTPTGEKEVIVNLNEYCRNHNLQQQNMVSVSKGIVSQHKGFRCKKLTDMV